MMQYLRDVRAELNHVSWPTQRQTIIYTVIVVAISLATAAYLGIFDYLFSNFILLLA
jgi:preprotein translocase SecE subunit